jgi:RimJ/RimL family protein N-acetyltransferase
MLHPTLATGRLNLRGFAIDDLDLLYALYGDSRVMQFLGDGTPMSRDVTQEKLAAVLFRWTQLRMPMWAVFRKADGVFLGRCGFSPYEPLQSIELAYTLIPSAWGLGYATEASRACLKHAFDELKWDRIMCRTRPTNLRSRRVMEKLGFEFEREGTDTGGAAVFYWLARGRPGEPS